MDETFEGLTQRQKLILNYLQNFYHINGYPPLIQDIQDALGIRSRAVVAYNLKLLFDKAKYRAEITEAIEDITRRHNVSLSH